MPTRLEDARISEFAFRVTPEFDPVGTLHEQLDSLEVRVAGGVIAQHPAAAEAQQDPRRELARQVAFARDTASLRLRLLADDAVHAINTRRYYLGALSARAYLEHAAALVHLQTSLSRTGSSTVSSLAETADVLRVFIVGGRFEWERYHESKEAREALIADYQQRQDVYPEVVARNAVTSIQALARHADSQVANGLGWIRMNYALLSDICHPAVGGFLGFRHEAGPPMRMLPEIDEVNLVSIGANLTVVLAYSTQFVVESLAELEAIEASLLSGG